MPRSVISFESFHCGAAPRHARALLVGRRCHFGGVPGFGGLHEILALDVAFGQRLPDFRIARRQIGGLFQILQALGRIGLALRHQTVERRQLNFGCLARKRRGLLQGGHGFGGIGLEPGHLGAAYFIVTIGVPLLFITHGLVFRLLLRGDGVAGARDGQGAS